VVDDVRFVAIGHKADDQKEDGQWYPGFAENAVFPFTQHQATGRGHISHIYSAREHGASDIFPCLLAGIFLALADDEIEFQDVMGHEMKNNEL
jgi:hypothetical protein